MKLALLGASILFSLVQPVCAGSLEPKRVDGEARWLMHVNFDAFRETLLGKKIRREKLDQPGVKQLLELAKDRYGIDLRDGLHGLTLYGLGFEKNQGVAVLSAHTRVRRCRM